MPVQLTNIIDLHELRFKQIDGFWTCINYDLALSPADVASLFNISIPDYTTFLRVRNFEDGWCFDFRDFHDGIIRIFLNYIND